MLMRFFDVVISIFVLVVLLPFFIVVALLIKLTSKGSAIFIQQRVGKNGRDFDLYKFRTMCENAELESSLTVGEKDLRITGIGFFLRKYKLDELPQLVNVLKNDMSLVGPRPELRKFVDMYSEEQKIVLSVKPGITDYASVKYRNENMLLALQKNPEEYYIKEIMPVKIQLNKWYIHNKRIKNYFYIILSTLASVFKKGA